MIINDTNKRYINISYFKKYDFNNNINIIILQSRYNYEISNILTLSCIIQLNKIFKNKNINININIKHITVPGILELPVIIKKILKEIKNIQSIIITGVVIKGETNHDYFISLSVFNAIVKISLNFLIPIINGIITVNNKKQAYNRIVKKGNNISNIALELTNLIFYIKNYINK